VCLVVGRDEVEVGADHRVDPLAVVAGRVERGLHEVGEGAEMAVQEGDVQLPLRGEVLIQDGLADLGRLGDLIHGSAVVAVGREDLERG
jgi:hypothetical protein